MALQRGRGWVVSQTRTRYDCARTPWLCLPPLFFVAGGMLATVWKYGASVGKTEMATQFVIELLEGEPTPVPTIARVPDGGARLCCYAEPEPIDSSHEYLADLCHRGSRVDFVEEAPQWPRLDDLLRGPDVEWVLVRAPWPPTPRHGSFQWGGGRR